MLTKPKYGWTNIILNEDTYQVSYLTDVPIDCLNSMINSLKYNIPFCVHFDTEDSYLVVLCSSYIYDNVQVIKYENTEIVKSYYIRLETLAKELYNDINDNLNEWSLWDYCGDEEEKVNNNYKNKLINKLSELKLLIDKVFNK